MSDKKEIENKDLNDDELDKVSGGTVTMKTPGVYIQELDVIDTNNPVNSEITDSDTKSNVKVLGEAPATAPGNLYDTPK